MYGFSGTLLYVASALSEPGGLGLGTLGLPEPVARKMTAEAGFTRFTMRDFEESDQRVLRGASVASGLCRRCIVRTT